MDKATAEKLIALSRNSYDNIAADFDITRKKEIWPEIREYAEQVKEGEKILDAGCGNGRLLEAFKNRNINYLGTDNSKELLVLAQKNYPNKQFVLADLINIELLENDKFEYIFCLAVFQHLPSKQLRLQALEKLRKHLKENGKIIMSNWNLWETKHKCLLYKNMVKKIFNINAMDFGDIVFPWKNKAGEIISDRYYHAFTRRELNSLFLKAGFKKIIIKKDKYNYWVEAGL